MQPSVTAKGFAELVPGDRFRRFDKIKSGDSTTIRELKLFDELLKRVQRRRLFQRESDFRSSLSWLDWSGFVCLDPDPGWSRSGEGGFFHRDFGNEWNWGLSLRITPKNLGILDSCSSLISCCDEPWPLDRFWVDLERACLSSSGLLGDKVFFEAMSAYVSLFSASLSAILGWFQHIFVLPNTYSSTRYIRVP